MNREKLIDKLNEEHKKHGRGWINEKAKNIGITYSQLYRIIHRISQGKISSWEKIYKYYEKKK